MTRKNYPDDEQREKERRWRGLRVFRAYGAPRGRLEAAAVRHILHLVTPGLDASSRLDGRLCGYVKPDGDVLELDGALSSVAAGKPKGCRKGCFAVVYVDVVEPLPKVDPCEAQAPAPRSVLRVNRHFVLLDLRTERLISGAQRPEVVTWPHHVFPTANAAFAAAQLKLVTL